MLHDAYANSLQLAAQHGARTIAFPAISTGVYRYPVEEAARIAHGVVRGHPAFDRIELVCFGPDVAEIFERVVA